MSSFRIIVEGECSDENFELLWKGIYNVIDRVPCSCKTCGNEGGLKVKYFKSEALD